jgi:predicted nucleotidyltransferase
MIQDLDVPIEAIRTLCRRYRVRELALFGSALRGDFNAESDVDLLVEFDPNVSVGFVTLARMQRELAAVFRRPVDLIPKSGLKPLIRQEVLSKAEVIYAA